MAKRSVFIRNPLTVVGVFAGVAEVSGIWVLAKLPHDLQSTFIWFVMVFPALLVVLFFVTLNFNARCLYAPSDFRDDTAFMDTISGMRRLTAREQEGRDLTATEVVSSSLPAPGLVPSDEGGVETDD